MKKDYLHNWITTFNCYSQEYVAVTRDNYFDLFNSPEKCLKAKTQKELENKIKMLP